MVVIATAAVQMMGILVSTAGGTWRPLFGNVEPSWDTRFSLKCLCRYGGLRVFDVYVCGRGSNLMPEADQGSLLAGRLKSKPILLDPDSNFF